MRLESTIITDIIVVESRDGKNSRFFYYLNQNTNLIRVKISKRLIKVVGIVTYKHYEILNIHFVHFIFYYKY